MPASSAQITGGLRSILLISWYVKVEKRKSSHVASIINDEVYVQAEPDPILQSRGAVLVGSGSFELLKRRCYYGDRREEVEEARV
eukprot:CAMPEP_0182470484 /NCGR_PEP_ID=MMETSP1319-20130603/18786_1 /TAXON_ID=172717 /ORGANISM="Bolidomonas pacifica, Strain RCC208" /LENGTH=84 /DNA_ID=CAMNT_0024670931 /DNA_START=51 /DNA_END=304 /DNA_ORIENTATION=+